MQEADRVDAFYGFQDLATQTQGGADAECTSATSILSTCLGCWADSTFSATLTRVSRSSASRQKVVPGCQLGITASHGTQAGAAVRDMGPVGTQCSVLLLPIAHCTATNRHMVYFWLSHTAAALPGQRDVTPNCPSHRESTLRMSACSAPPLIPSADQGRCPHCFPPRPAASDWAGHLGLDGEPYRSLRETKLLETSGRMITKGSQDCNFCNGLGG
ncbi:hypothetical protein INR49_031345 [Caranx melampygus]|nr:hypothetical protein INR49_031345 [Caranx melampygus]